MQVKTLEAQHFGLYNDFLSAHPCAMFYYSLSYKALLEDFLGCKTQYLIAVSAGRIEGVLPLMSRDGLYGRVLNSLPFYGSNGGILSFNVEARIALAEVYKDLSREYSSSVYITNPLEEISKDCIAYDYEDRRIGQWSLLKGQEDLLKSFASSRQRNIRRALREGIVVETTQDLEVLFTMHRQNISSKDGIYKEKRFFDSIIKHCAFGKDYRVFMAYWHGIPIAGLLVFYYGDVIEYYTPALEYTYSTFQALPLTIFQAMCVGYEEGYKWWNWGGTWQEQDGVYRFKHKFGAVDKTYYYYITIHNSKILSATKEELLSEYPYFYVIPFGELGKV